MRKQGSLADILWEYDLVGGNLRAGRAGMNESVIQRAVEGNDPTLAEEALREIERLLGSPLDHQEKMLLLFSKAHCYGILGDFAEARRQFAVALDEGREDPDTRLTFDLSSGLLLQREGRYAEALDRFGATLSTYRQQLRRPDLRFMYEDIQQRMGFLSVTLSRFQDAVPLLRESLSFDLDKETRSAALASLGLCYLKLKDYELSKDYFLEAIALGLTTEWQGTAHFYLGISYFHADMLQEAKREFLLCEELATVYNVPIADIYGWLSAICKRLGETPESERYARLAKRN